MKVGEFFKELRTVRVGVKPWFSDYVFLRKWKVGRLEITAAMRSKNGWMGRFGGGWQYKFGIDIGGSTVIINLIVMNVRIAISRKEGETEG